MKLEGLGTRLRIHSKSLGARRGGTIYNVGDHCLFVFNTIIRNVNKAEPYQINPLPTNGAYMRHELHNRIRICMGGLILGVNTLHMLFCFFKLFPMVGKGLKSSAVPLNTLGDHDHTSIRAQRLAYIKSVCHNN